MLNLPVNRNSKNELHYSQRQGALWLANIFKHEDIKITDNLLTLFEYCTGQLINFVKPLLEKIPDIHDKLIMGRNSYRNSYKSIEELLSPPLSYVPRKVFDFIESFPELESLFVNSIGEYLQSFILKHPPEIPYEFHKAMDTFSTLFKLNDNAIKIIDHVFLIKMFAQLHNYLQGDLMISHFEGRRYLAAALNMSLPTLKDSLSKLEHLGIINSRNHLDFYSDDLLRLWELPEGQNPEEFFCSPLRGDCLPLSDFSVAHDQVTYLLELLRKPSKSPRHILLYGPSGTGKTTFARSLVSALGVRAWAVAAANCENAGMKRRMALTVSMNLAAGDKGSLVVADEAEALLSDSNGSLGQSKSSDKSWINEFMETPGNPVIWIVNYLDKIDLSTKRRFSFALYFPPLGLKERTKMWDGIIVRHKATPSPENQIYKDLVRKYEVPAAVIDRAVENALEIGAEEELSWENVAISIKSFVQLQNDGEHDLSKREENLNFAPSGVTAGIEVETLAARLKALDRVRGPEGLPPGSGTVLFYGPPGTGKTALERYLAKVLGKEALIKKGSDLLDCFVGMTEKNIARAFRQAEKEDAVLVFDEADSFFYSREIAQRSWEVSFVNEFLANAEECRCFMIATSNRRESMDPAAMRRFSFKVPFRYAGREQLEVLYLAILAPLVGNSPGTAFLSCLTEENNLAPGDFHAVRLRYRAIPEKGVTHEELFRELLLERDLKLDKGCVRRIGF
jgi:DNA replication protein DnaC